jgi:hypothetical protein
MKTISSFSRTVAVLVFGLSTLLTVSVNAQKVVSPKAGGPGEWRKIGTTEASKKADHDTIVVAGPHDSFRKLKIKVKDAPLILRRMVVTYESGKPDELEVRHQIAKGGESGPIDLKGSGKRRIRTIDFYYETKNGKHQGRADVTVFGMK